ncbi:MAG: energy transducer TonB [Pseudomonadota bacterium]
MISAAHIRASLALLIAVSVHLSIFSTLPSLLIKQPEPSRPQAISVTITMSDKALEPTPPKIKKKVRPIPKPKSIMKTQKTEKKESPKLSVKVPAPPKKILPVKALPAETQPEPFLPDQEKPDHSTPEPEVKPELDQPLHQPQPSQAVKTQKQIITASETQKESIEIIKITDPEFKTNPLPQYPERARKKGYEGLVELKVLISIDGQVSEIKIHKSAGYAILDHQAIKTVKKWLFEPRKNNDQAIETWVMIPIRFKLN